MAMQTLIRQVTYREFRAMEFSESEGEEFIFELINGEIMARNYPSAMHQRVLRRLTVQVDAFVNQNQLGEVFFAPFGVVLSDFNDVQPDLIFVGKEQADIVREEGVFGVPDLLMEVISPSSIRTDRRVKFKMYEEMGVKEYWIVDLKNQSIEVYTLDETGFEMTSFGVEKGAVMSIVLPEFMIDLEMLFA